MTFSFEEDIEPTRVGSVIARAFFDLPLNRYMISSLNGLDSADELDYEKHFEEFFVNRTRQVVDAGARVTQSKDYASVAIWFEPGHKSAPFPSTNPVVCEYGDKSAALKKKYNLTNKKYWYLNYLAKDPQKEDVKGAVSATVKPILELAREQGLPVVLEAVADHAREVYEHFGFKILESFQLLDERTGDAHPVYLMAFNYDI
ncbi:hypothetical protein CAAN1_18S02410 [[Candida] anglica]|uniref:N-acetyltransferase domain-containing protein n=1 Tax=[Candida] anglica TaxID=148631 RepID=A0ABP0EQZ3_9ASCO